MLRTKGQSIIEYSLLAMLIIVGTIVMGPYVVRSIGAHFKLWQESIDDSINDRMTEVPINVAPPDCQCSGKTYGGCGSTYQRTGQTCQPDQRYWNTPCSPSGCGYGNGFSEGCDLDTDANPIPGQASCCSLYNACSLTSPIKSCCGKAPLPSATYSPATDQSRHCDPSNGCDPLPNNTSDLHNSCYYSEELMFNQCNTTQVRCLPISATNNNADAGQCDPLCVGNLPRDANGDPTIQYCPGADTGLTRDWPLTVLGSQSVCTTFTLDGSGNPVVTGPGTYSVAPATKTITWVPPISSTYSSVKIWGGGGGYTGDECGGAGGGGGGAYAQADVLLEPGVNYSVTVGSGGNINANGEGNNGSSSSFGLPNGATLLTAGGGIAGGTPVCGNGNNAGGSGGQATVDNSSNNVFNAKLFIGLLGAGGGAGQGGWNAGGDGGNAAGSGGVGGIGGPGSNGNCTGTINTYPSGCNGQPGSSPGGGGGGGGDGADNDGRGGAGGNGMVKICMSGACPDYTANPQPPKCLAKCKDGYQTTTDANGNVMCIPCLPLPSCNPYSVTCTAWGGFMQKYAMWVAPASNVQAFVNKLATFSRIITIPSTDTYTVRFSADNTGKVIIDGNTVCNQVSIYGFNSYQDCTVGLTAGTHNMVLETTNTPGSDSFSQNPAGVAMQMGTGTGTTFQPLAAPIDTSPSQLSQWTSSLTCASGLAWDCSNFTCATATIQASNCTAPNPPSSCSFNGTYYGYFFTKSTDPASAIDISVTCANNAIRGICTGSKAISRGTFPTQDCIGSDPNSIYCNWSGNKFFYDDRHLNDFTINCSNNQVVGFWTGDQSTGITGCNWSGVQQETDCGDGNDMSITCTNGSITNFSVTGPGTYGCQWGP